VSLLPFHAAAQQSHYIILNLASHVLPATAFFVAAVSASLPKPESPLHL